MIRSTDVALDWELARIGAMAELLTAITLRNGVPGFQIFYGDSKVEEAR